MAVDVKRAKNILEKPFFLIEKLSFLIMRSFPMNVLIKGLRRAATGRIADVLSPMRPSEIQSTDSPLMNVISRHSGVLTLRGMHNTIAGSMDSVMYGPRLL